MAWSFGSLGLYGLLLLAAFRARAHAFFTASFAFLIARFLAASVHTDGFFKIFMAAGFFKIFMAAGFFIMHVMNDVMASSFSCCVCVKLGQRFLESHVLHKKDMSPELSLEHVCLLVCVFVCVFV